MRKKSGLGTNPFGTTEIGIFSPTEPTGADETLKDEALKEGLSVSLEKIIPPKQQPRRYFDPDKMQELIHSVEKHGILEPLLVRLLSSESFELVAGERRYRAAKKLGLTEIPVIVRQLTDEEALHLALTENLQREDLSPVEETEGVITLLSAKLHLPASQIPQLLHRLAKSSDNVVGNEERSQIQAIESVFKTIGRITWGSFATHRLPLLNLPPTILEALRAGKIEYTKARAISRLKDSTLQQKLLSRVIEEGMPLSQIRSEVVALNHKSSAKSTPVLKKKFDDASIRLRKSNIWSNQDKQKKLEKLLTEIESLLEES